MTTITTVHPAPIAMPRGALWAARAALALVAAAERLFTQRDASAHTRAEEAEALRHYANTLRHSDPGLAADLYAAADRHDAQA